MTTSLDTSGLLNSWTAQGEQVVVFLLCLSLIVLLAVLITIAFPVVMFNHWWNGSRELPVRLYSAVQK